MSRFSHGESRVTSIQFLLNFSARVRAREVGSLPEMCWRIYLVFWLVQSMDLWARNSDGEKNKTFFQLALGDQGFLVSCGLTFSVSSFKKIVKFPHQLPYNCIFLGIKKKKKEKVMHPSQMSRSTWPPYPANSNILLQWWDSFATYI